MEISPIGFIDFLAADFRKYKAHLENVDQISFFIGTTEINEYSSYRLEVLLRMLVTFCVMRRPCVAGTALRAMQLHLEGFDRFDGNKNYPDDLSSSNIDLQPITSSSRDVT